MKNINNKNNENKEKEKNTKEKIQQKITFKEMKKTQNKENKTRK